MRSSQIETFPQIYMAPLGAACVAVGKLMKESRMAKLLAHFSISRTGEDYVLMLEDEDGDTSEFVASYDQLDLITDAIAEELERDDDDLLSVEADEDEIDE